MQNILRAGAPGFGASPTDVTDYFAHHRVVVLVPLGLFPLGMVALFAFTAGVWNRTRPGDDHWWADMGALGVGAIAALFALVNITEIALAAKVDQLSASPAVVQTLWAAHTGAFGLVLAAQAVGSSASRAALSTGLLPHWFGRVAVAGAACLLTTAVFTVAIANGGPWIALGMAGFLVWGIFIVFAALRLARGFRPARG